MSSIQIRNLEETSDNRAYLASCYFAKIPLRGTSDTLGTLYEIANPAKTKRKFIKTIKLI